MKRFNRWTTWAALAATFAVGFAFFSGGPRVLAAASGVATALPLVEITVYKSPTCGCCTKWVDHLTASGFKVTAHDTTDMASVKTSLGVPDGMASCHTAVVNGYVVEGHVPAADIRRLLEEKPAVTGLAVPGMPMGSPGMEGTRTDKYDVLAFGKGKAAVFARH